MKSVMFQPIRSAYFYCCDSKNPCAASYQHSSVSLAEGLHELGIPVYSNINYWQIKEDAPRYLFSYDPEVEARDCELVVLDSEYLLKGAPFPPFLKERKRKNIFAFIDLSDAVYSHSFDQELNHFDLILRASYNSRARGYPENLRPWYYGTTNRIIEACSRRAEWKNRQSVILSNYRCLHPVRALAEKSGLYSLLAPRLAMDSSTDDFSAPDDATALFEWKKTGRRHNPHYYQRLCNSKASACFGGYFYSRYFLFSGKKYHDAQSRRSLTTSIKEWGQAVLNKLLPLSQKAVFQWDSFRLWETFSAAALVFHLDFRHYGLELPVMPENRKHYIGINFDNLEQDIDFLLSADDSTLGNIAENGCKWMMEHYRPRATAERLLRYCSGQAMFL